MWLKSTWRIINRALESTIIQHDGIEHAGYLSFLGLLCTFPFLVFLVALAGFIGEGELGTTFIAMMRDILPNDVMQALLPRFDEILSGPPPGLLTISMLAALWTASSAVEGYRTVLNRAYHVGTPPAYIWRRLLSIAQLLLFAFLVLVVMLLMLVLPLALQQIERILGIHTIGDDWREWGGGLQILSILILTLVVANMYYLIPNVRQRFLAVLPGAAFTVLCWLAAAQLFTLYLDNFDQVNLIYGSLGGIIAVLLFFYILNLIFIFGAELNYQILRDHGERVVEKEQTALLPNHNETA
jgi:membrane protein